MVNNPASVWAKFLIVALICVDLSAQTNADRERRLGDLERRMRQLDPGFSPETGADFDARLAALERQLNTLLASRDGGSGSSEVAVSAALAAQPAAPATTPVPAPI